MWRFIKRIKISGLRVERGGGDEGDRAERDVRLSGGVISAFVAENRGKVLKIVKNVGAGICYCEKNGYICGKLDKQWHMPSVGMWLP